MKRSSVRLYGALAFAVGMYATAVHSACDNMEDEPPATIQSRLDALEAQIKEIPLSARSDPKLRLLQERALVELEKLQCAREKQSPPEELKRGPDIETTFVQVPLLFI